MEGRPRYNEERADDTDELDDATSSKKKRRKVVSGLSRVVQRTEVASSDSWTGRFEKIRDRKLRPIIPEVEPVKDEKDGNEKKNETKHQDQEEPAVEDVLEDATQVTEDGTIEHSGNVAGVEFSDEPIDTSETNQDEESAQAPEQLSSESEVVKSEEMFDDEDASIEKPGHANEPILPVWPVVEVGRVAESRARNRVDISETPRLESLIDNQETADPVEEPVSLEVDSAIPVEPGHEYQIPIETDSRPVEQRLVEEEDVASLSESLEDILRRQPVAREYEERGNGESQPDYVSSAPGETVEMHNNTNPNVGLHLLNYALAKRRDSRNMQRVNKKIEHSNTRIQHLEEQKRAQNELSTMYEKQQVKSSNKSKERTIFNRSTDIATRDVEKNTSIKTEQTLIDRSALAENSRQAILAHQRTLESLQNTVITSEKLYEQRHEAKDNILPSSSGTTTLIDDSSDSSTAGNYTGGHSAEKTATRSIAGSTARDPDPTQPSAWSDRSTEAKQLVVTSVMGVVAGIIAFLIIYLFTRR